MQTELLPAMPLAARATNSATELMLAAKMASRSSTFWKGAASTNQQLRFDKNINSDKFQLYHMYFDQERRSTREGALSLV